jgi:hypothetical protein
VGWLTPERQYWVVEPLLDAGLGLEQIRSLVFRLAFDAMVGGVSGAATILRNVVADQPAPVQRAWAEAISRLIVVRDLEPAD